jgi:YD repeat-containing protein
MCALSTSPSRAVMKTRRMPTTMRFASPALPTRTYGYDNAGNTTSFTGVTFTYNNRGRMKSSTKTGVTTNYTYNALGQLIKKGTSALYYYDDAGHVLGVYNNGGALIEEIVWLGDIPLATLRPKSGGGIDIYYIHSDHLNTPRLVTASIGSGVHWRWDAEPFGGGTVNNNPAGAGVFEFNLRFPGQIYFAETGLPVAGSVLRQRRCYIVADDGTVYGLYPENGIGVPRTNDPRDLGGDCFDCPAIACTDQNSCLKNAHNRYPRGDYSLGGPNSNTYAGSLAKGCCNGGIPSGVSNAPGVGDPPPKRPASNSRRR